MGTGFSSLEILQEPEVRGRSAEIVRFDIPYNVLTVTINLHFRRLTEKKPFSTADG